MVSALPINNNKVEWLNQAFTVEGYSYYYASGQFPSGLTLDMSFTVNGAPLDFIGLTALNFENYKENKEYNLISSISAPSVSSYHKSWVPSSASVSYYPEEYNTVYYVWDNSQSSEAKNVTALFTYENKTTILPPLATTFGLLLFFSGFAFFGYGTKPLLPVNSKKQILIGYLFAVLGGFIGLLIGYGLMRSTDEVNKFHGKVILAIAVIALIAFMAQTAYLLFG